MIKKWLFHRKNMTNSLIAISILMFCSMFTGNAKIAGVGFSLWVTIVFWNVYLMLNSNNMCFGTVVSEINNKYEVAKERKERGKQLLYGITLPMICVGLITVMLILVTFFTIL